MKQVLNAWPVCWPVAPRIGLFAQPGYVYHVLATPVRQLQPQRTCCPATSVPSNSDTVWPVGRAVAHCMGRAGSGQLVRALCGAGAAVVWQHEAGRRTSRHFCCSNLPL